jgi:sporulation protein YlmC with PRC-barrel domain
VHLSDLLGRPVRGPTGTQLGRVADVAVSLAEPHPRAIALLVRHHGDTARAAWGAVASLGPEAVVLHVAPGPDRAARDELLLARDVLDAQIVDVAGRRVRRVADVELAGHGGELRVLAVDTSLAGVLRRLGLRRLTARRPAAEVDWADVHLASGPGHALQLASPAAAVHRLSARELAAVAAHLSAAREQQLLHRVAKGPVPAPPRHRRRFPHRRWRRARS